MDGQLEDSVSDTAATIIDVRGLDKYIGHRNGGFFDGHIDELRVWNAARTPEELAATMYTRVNREYGLVGNWRFDDATGTVAEDSAGRGFFGNLEAQPVDTGPGPLWSTVTPW